MQNGKESSIMNETISVLMKRRSIRKYLPDQINDDDLTTILQTGLYAPSGGDHQYTRFFVIQDTQRLYEISSIVRQEFAKLDIIEGQYQNKTIIKAKQQENYNFMYEAPTLIVAVAPKTHGNSMADSANGLENMQIAATALGLGACWVNQLHWLTGNEVLRSYFEPLGLSEDEDIFGSIVIGYPALPLHQPTSRKEGRIVIVK